MYKNMNNVNKKSSKKLSITLILVIYYKTINVPKNFYLKVFFKLDYVNLLRDINYNFVYNNYYIL